MVEVELSVEASRVEIEPICKNPVKTVGTFKNWILPYGECLRGVDVFFHFFSYFSLDVDNLYERLRRAHRSVLSTPLSPPWLWA